MKRKILRASNKMNCRTENERFSGMQGGRGKIAGSIVVTILRTILPRQRSMPENKPFECKGILLDALKVNSLIVLLAVSTVILAGCKDKAKTFGEAISERTITPIKSILMKPADYNDKTITIEGKIIDECPAGGWFDLLQGTAPIYVDLHPTGVAIPQKVGSIVTVQGTVELRDNKPVLVGSGVEIK